MGLLVMIIRGKEYHMDTVIAQKDLSPNRINVPVDARSKTEAKATLVDSVCIFWHVNREDT